MQKSAEPGTLESPPKPECGSESTRSCLGHITNDQGIGERVVGERSRSEMNRRPQQNRNRKPYKPVGIYVSVEKAAFKRNANAMSSVLLEIRENPVERM